MTGMETIVAVSNLFDTLESNQFVATELKFTIKNPCNNLDIIKVFKTRTDFTNYVSNKKKQADCTSQDFMVLQSAVITNNNIVVLGHIFNTYDIPNTLIINDKYVYKNYNLVSTKSKVDSYKSHLTKILKVYQSNISSLVVPNKNDQYIDCCYIEDGYYGFS